MPDTSVPSESEAELATLLEEINKEFFDFCKERQDEGAQTYGPVAFLQNDMFQYMMEELADLANYARFAYIKLRLMERLANERGVDMSPSPIGEVRIAHEVPFGPTAFVGVGEVFSLLSEQEK